MSDDYYEELLDLIKRGEIIITPTFKGTAEDYIQYMKDIKDK